MTTDVIVIGAGVIGCSIAYQLAQEKIKVLVVERNWRPGCESSGAAAGMLIAEGERHQSRELFELCLKSRELYPDFVSRLTAESGMQVEHRKSGLIYLAFSEDDEKELERCCSDRTAEGLHVEKLTASELRSLEPRLSDKARFGLRFDAEQYVDNVKLVQALAIAASRSGVQFRFGSPVTGFLVERDKVVGVEVSGEKLQAGCIINAAGSWAGLIDPKLGRVPVKPARGQIVLVKSLQPFFNHIIFSPRAYIAGRNDGRMLLGTTVEFVGFDKQVTVEGVEEILRGALEICPDLKRLPIIRAWAGLRPYSQDGLPILGRSGIEGLLIATGHFRNGILLAPITARLISELVMGGKTPSELEPFAPSRFK